MKCLSAFFLEIKVTDVLLVIFNGLLAYVTWLLWKSTRGLEQAAIKQGADMQQSLQIAAEAADAAKKSADAAALNSKIIASAERPYLAASGDFDLTFQTGRHPTEVSTFAIRLENLGRSPAIIVRAVVGTEFRLHDQPILEYGDFETTATELYGVYLKPSEEIRADMITLPTLPRQYFNGVEVSIAITVDYTDLLGSPYSLSQWLRPIGKDRFVRLNRPASD